ncbi:hypothetical protein TIFTF001_015491 [Ficus carica]|uniref:Uncharacterized protein n=1 Tax=Ficus carica TaxID=3494 RepID=A0AA88D6K6_FICCA|nr:hypothetical protein TIFTF001_015491 [Ficus carica]
MRPGGGLDDSGTRVRVVGEGERSEGAFGGIGEVEVEEVEFGDSGNVPRRAWEEDAGDGWRWSCGGGRNWAGGGGFRFQKGFDRQRLEALDGDLCSPRFCRRRRGLRAVDGLSAAFAKWQGGRSLGGQVDGGTAGFSFRFVRREVSFNVIGIFYELL